MITSIVVTGTHTIKMNSNKKIKIGDNVLSVEKDIPFIRYRFNQYTEAEYNYILNTMKQFCFSTHLAEVPLSENTANTVRYLVENIKNIAKYVYVNITNEDMSIGDISADKLALLDTLVGLDIDRIMLKDKTPSLDTVTAKRFIKTLSKRLGFSEDTFGVCSSPLSFSDWACLTAVKARELMSIYSTIADVALPSANHQCMNCCGCIRYVTVTADTEAPSDGKVKATKEKSDGDTKEPKQPKAPKQKVMFGLNNI